MSKPTVAILGASSDRGKYGNKSVRAHLSAGYEVYPINPRVEEVEGIKVYSALADVPVERLDRISVYLPPQIGISLLEEIQARGAEEVWFNPGSESKELVTKAAALGLEIIRACSIIGAGTSPHDFPDE